MALYFAGITITSGTGPRFNLYDLLVDHYSKVPANSAIPTLLPPIPKMVSWIRLHSPNPEITILGTISSAPYYFGVQKLDTPVEYFGGGNRNTIALSSIIFDTGAAAISLYVTFQVI